MTDSIFDWGKDGDPTLAPVVSKEQARLNREAVKAAKEAALQAAIAKDKQEFDKREAALQSDLAVKPTELTHILVTRFVDEPSKAIKQLLGYKIDKERYVRITSHARFGPSSWNGEIDKPGIWGKDCIGIFFTRLTKSEAMKARLHITNKLFVIDDPDGELWHDIYLGVIASRFRQSTNPYMKSNNQILSALSQIVPLRTI